MTSTLLNNRYCLLRVLGAGGFGETFLAEDTQMPSSRRCVIKQLKPVMNNPQVYQLVQERFQREAAILEELGEGNAQIPSLYAYFSEKGQFYLVQEWVPGQTLREKVQKEGRLSESFVKEIVESLLSVLDYVHSKRIVHRDIKPDNIILRDSDGKPVLIDFGAVRETMGTLITSGGNNTRSIVIGTPGFMPSEQASGRPVYSSDLYSLGLTAIYLLTGKVPQELETEPLNGEIIWRQYALSISPSLAAVLDQAIRPHASDRYSTARAMLNALRSSTTTILPTAPPLSSSPQTLPLSLPSSSQGSGQKGILMGSLIGGGLIGASVILGLLLTKPFQQVARQTTASSVKPQSEKPQAIETSSPTPTHTTQSVINPSPSSQPTSTIPSTVNPSVPPTSAVSSTPSSTAELRPKEGLSQPEDYSWLSYKPVTDSDLAGKSAFELDTLRNSIYARHGRQFRNSELQDFFNSQPWYRPIYNPNDFPNNLLSTLEQQNAAYILNYQNRHGLRWAR